MTCRVYKPLKYSEILDYKGVSLGRADREGFEPSRPFRAYTISNRARSTTLAPVLGNLFCGEAVCAVGDGSQVETAILRTNVPASRATGPSSPGRWRPR